MGNNCVWLVEWEGENALLLVELLKRRALYLVGFMWSRGGNKMQIVAVKMAYNKRNLVEIETLAVNGNHFNNKRNSWLD